MEHQEGKKSSQVFQNFGSVGKGQTNIFFYLGGLGFFPWGDWGSLHPAKILSIPSPSDTCPRFWTKACPPSAEVCPQKFDKFKYIFRVKFDYF